MTVALAGAGIGLAAAFALTRFMHSLLFGVRGTDPLTFVAVAGLLTAISFVASYLPARAPRGSIPWCRCDRSSKAGNIIPPKQLTLNSTSGTPARPLPQSRAVLNQQLREHRPMASRFVLAIAADRQIRLRRQRSQQRKQPLRLRPLHLGAIPPRECRPAYCRERRGVRE